MSGVCRARERGLLDRSIIHEWRLNRTHHRRWRALDEGFKSPQHWQPDPHIVRSTYANQSFYSCSRCNRYLAAQANVIELADRITIDCSVKKCHFRKMIAIEPIEWIVQYQALALKESMGQLRCPSCRTTVGRFMWHSLKCTECKATGPAFLLSTKAVTPVPASQ